MTRSLWTRRQFGRMAGAAALCNPLFAERRFEPALGPDVRGANSLRAHGAAAGILAGCAVVPELLDLSEGSLGPDSDAYTRTVADQADILVAENAMKWSSLRPTASTYNFAPADRLFAFAAAYRQQVRGHNLCWHEQLPAWFSSVATKDNAATLLTQHIQTVAGRYTGRVHSWDVVNEAVYLQDGRPDGLRNSPWLQLIGPSYIELAFTAATKADPHAKLTYNDYDIELDTPEQTAKRGQVLLLVRRLIARGVPLHAIGIQSHLQATGPKPGAGVISMIREAARLGLEVYITEMDVNTHQLDGGADAQDAAVAEVYKSYLGLVLAEPNVKAVLTWGITDAHTWLNQIRQPWTMRPDGSRQRPLPFDEQYRPAPAFFAIRNALDTARQPAPQPITNSPAQPESDPYAPFAVPGSPGTVSQPPSSSVPKPNDQGNA